MIVTDPGHSYLLDTLDGDGAKVPLVFVKRCDPPENYPGNVDAYPGVTLQEVLRACIERGHYVNGQFACEETTEAIECMQRVVLLLERRAKRRRDETLDDYTLEQAWRLPTCSTCGHVDCTQHAPF